MNEINFFNEDVSLTIESEDDIRSWLLEIIRSYKYSLETLNYIFCSDGHLLGINIEYLNHDTYTDIITFDNSEVKTTIEGDVFISLERVRENAEIFKSSIDDELHRVMVHGLLHLLGHGDKTDEEKVKMRNKENECLLIRNQFISIGKRST